MDGEAPTVEGEEEEPGPGQPEEQRGNQDLWDSLLTVLPQQWHQALNLLRVSGGLVRTGRCAVEWEG